MTLHCYTTTSSAKKSGDGDAESLLDLTHFLSPAVSCNFFYFYYVLDVIFSLHVDCNRSSLQSKLMKSGSFLIYFCIIPLTSMK
jgi:hypothetical protein